MGATHTKPSDTSEECYRNGETFISLSQDIKPLPSHPASEPASPTAKPAETRAAWLRSDRVHLTVFVLLDFVLIGLLAVAVSHAFFHHGNTTTSLQDDDHPLLLEDTPFCLPCREVYLTDQDVERNVFKVKQRVDEQENITLCCAESHDDLNALIGEMAVTPRLLAECGKFETGLMSWKKDDSEPAVLPGTMISHLSLHCTAEPTAGTDGTKTLPLSQSKAAPGGRTADYTDSNNNITTSNNNITTTNNNNNITNTTNTQPRYAVVVSNGSVRIQHSGYYYIYSHLPFNFRYSPPSTSSPSPSSPPSSDSEPISSAEPATQYVVRVRNGTDLVLLENSVYPCVVGLTRHRCEYSFAGGIFLLEQNDELSLRISHHACVEKDKGVNFGVQLL